MKQSNWEVLHWVLPDFVCSVCWAGLRPVCLERSNQACGVCPQTDIKDMTLPPFRFVPYFSLTHSLQHETVTEADSLHRNINKYCVESLVAIEQDTFHLRGYSPNPEVQVLVTFYSLKFSGWVSHALTALCCDYILFHCTHTAEDDPADLQYYIPI